MNTEIIKVKVDTLNNILSEYKPKDVDIDQQLENTRLFDNIAEIIESRKFRAGAYANREITLMYWEVGRYINFAILTDRSADYGKKILAELSTKLMGKYGKSFSEKNLYRMSLFAKRFSDVEILPPMAVKLNWSHFIELLILKTDEASINNDIQKSIDYFFESKDDDW